MTAYRVRHQTQYNYAVPVVHAHHLAHLRPRNLDCQTVSLSKIEVRPKAQAIVSAQDYFGNLTDALEMLIPHQQLDVTVTSEVQVFDRPIVDRLGCEASPAWELVRDRLARDLHLTAEREFTFDSPLVRAHPMLLEYVLPSFAPGRAFAESLQDLNRRIFDDFTYAPATTDISTPLGQVMRERRGVCQDFAHVMTGCLRSLGLAARYVSGYLETLPPPGQPRLVGADASHAWCSCLIPDWGWLDLDPTNAVLPAQRHITVGFGRDFSDVSPLQGVVLGGGDHSLSVSVDVQKIGN